MVHTRFSSVSRSPSECASASKEKSKMSPKEVAMKKSKLKGKGKKTNFTIQDNAIAPPKVLHFSSKLVMMLIIYLYSLFCIFRGCNMLFLLKSTRQQNFTRTTSMSKLVI